MTHNQQHASVAILLTILSCLLAAIVVLGVTSAQAGAAVALGCDAGPAFRVVPLPAAEPAPVP